MDYVWWTGYSKLIDLLHLLSVVVINCFFEHIHINHRDLRWKWWSEWLTVLGYRGRKCNKNSNRSISYTETYWRFGNTSQTDTRDTWLLIQIYLQIRSQILVSSGNGGKDLVAAGCVVLPASQDPLHPSVACALRLYYFVRIWTPT